MLDQKTELPEIEKSDIEVDYEKVNYEQDYKDYMSKAKKQEEEQKVEIRIPPDQYGNFKENTTVYRDENGVDYDAYMIKVDLKNGFYAEYVFYKLQILHDSVRDLYTLWTRYGRIGEQGMF